MKRRTDIVFGIHPIIELIRSGKTISKLLIKRGMKHRGILEIISRYRIPFQMVPIEKLHKITSKNHQGIIAYISPINFVSLENILPKIFEQGKFPLILILDNITDVRNLGAIIRTAECAGVDAIIIPERGSAQITTDVLKTSVGALAYIPICREKNIINTINTLKCNGLEIFACSQKAKKNLYASQFNVPAAIILGSEEKGISSALLERADYSVCIHMKGKIDSLNVSVATGVILFEVLRQREKKQFL